MCTLGWIGSEGLIPALPSECRILGRRILLSEQSSFSTRRIFTRPTWASTLCLSGRSLRMPNLITALAELVTPEYYNDGYLMQLVQYDLSESPLEL